MSVFMRSNAYGKVPQSIGCFLKVPKSNKNNLYFKMFDIRRNQKDSKGTTKEQNVPKENQAEPRKLHKFNQKGAPKKENQVKSDFFFIKFSIRNYKNDHGAFVRITWVKGTSVDEFF